MIESEDLIDIRKQMGLNREEMAEQLGIAARTLEGLEKERATITATIEKFAILLLEYHKLKVAQDPSKMDLWRMLLDEREKNRRIKERRKEWYED